MEEKVSIVLTIIQTLIFIGAIAGIYSKIKSDIEVLRTDIKWIKRALFKEEN